MAEQLVNDIIQKDKVVVFSKTTCPYCLMAKETLDKAGIRNNYKAIELEHRGERRVYLG